MTCLFVPNVVAQCGNLIQLTSVYCTMLHRKHNLWEMLLILLAEAVSVLHGISI